MSFVITVYAREGIVLASDSRMTLNTSTQQGPNQNVHFAMGQSDSNYKTFLALDRIGISTYGAADIAGVPLAGFIESFVATNLVPDATVEAAAHALLDYFRAQAGPPATFFQVAGYGPAGPVDQQLWTVNVAGDSVVRANPPGPNGPIQGATWGGESDVLARLLQRADIYNEQAQLTNQFPAVGIPWQFFTLQDAIDFAVYAVRVTSDSIRFQIRPKTVGGPIDVLVIRPTEAIWIARKVLATSQ